MFAKQKIELPVLWMHLGIIGSLLGWMLHLPPGKGFFLGMMAPFVSCLVAQLCLSIPCQSWGVNRYWAQMVLSETCKWCAFSFIMYWNISHNGLGGDLVLGIIISQCVVFWNYIKYG